MESILKILIESSQNYTHWIISLITFKAPWYQNYFWGLILISLFVWGLEILFPWRKQQSVFRKDFWLDAFYMFFNFFVFGFFITGFYQLFAHLSLSAGIEPEIFSLLPLKSFSPATQLVLFFILNDFVQWFTHVLLHKYDFLWRFHQIHHSVKEMGFAAHLRYHWMENLFYKPLKTLVILIVGGFEPEQAYIIHFAAITIGHFNHANLNITWGPLKYVFNNPVMHLFHHAYSLPKDRRKGVNFGISLSVWDYLFGTNYIPNRNPDTLIGFKGDEKLPTSFWKQLWVGFGFKNKG